METLESSRVCRLCGQHSGISINIFDENENHVRKINAVLPIMVHEMDLLPKQMCHRCSYKLEEFHKFYVDCLKTDAALKSQLSWMRKSHGREKIGVPMVHIENVKIKAEPLDYDVYDLVENIDYINSMAFPAGGIHHDGLTYAAFSRYRCCCDKKDQSRPRRRTTAELCRNYEERMARCDGIANDSRKRTLASTAAKIRPIKRNLFTQNAFPDCPQNPMPLAGVVDEAQNRLEINAKDDVRFSLSNRNQQRHGRFEELPGNHAVSRIVRNLRPRKNLVNYASKKKKRASGINAESFAVNKPNVQNLKLTSTLNLEPTVQLRAIKVEQTDAYEGRNLRPRRNVVDYQESKTKKASEHHAKRRKVDNVKQSSELRNKNALNALKLKIKQEAIDDLEDMILIDRIGATSRLPNELVKITDLPMKIEALTSDDITDYRSQFRDKFNIAKRKSIMNIAKNKIARTKRIHRLSAANYSPKCLRSQDAYLRSGKTRKNDYAEWSARKMQTRKLMEVSNNKKMPAMLKLIESIKHFCDNCNVSFANKELFRLHACYCD